MIYTDGRRYQLMLLRCTVSTLEMKEMEISSYFMYFAHSQKNVNLESVNLRVTISFTLFLFIKFHHKKSLSSLWRNMWSAIKNDLFEFVTTVQADTTNTLAQVVGGAAVDDVRTSEYLYAMFSDVILGS